MTHGLFFRKCAAWPLTAFGAVLAFVVLSGPARKDVLTSAGSVEFWAGMGMLCSFMVIREFLHIPKSERKISFRNPWVYLWGALLLPGITLYAVSRYVAYCYRCVTLRWHMRKLRETQQAALPFIPTPPWLLARCTQNGRAAYRKPETVLETSSVASPNGLDARELGRRNNIIATDNKIRYLQLERAHIKNRWVSLLTVREETLQEENNTRNIHTTRALIHLTECVNSHFSFCRTYCDESHHDCCDRIRKVGYKIAAAQRQLAQARHKLCRHAAHGLSSPSDTGAYADAFEKLLAFPNVLAIDVDTKRRFISAYTDTLYIDTGMSWCELGNFRIDFTRYMDSSHWQFYVSNLASTHFDGRYTPYGLRDHCFGNELTVYISGLLRKKEIPGAMVHILKSLTQVNSARDALATGFKFVTNGGA